MFMTMLARHAQQALDLDALEPLPRRAAGARARAAARARRRGPPRARPRAAVERELVLRRVVADDGSARRCTCASACTPTSASAWYTAFVCGPGRPTVAVVDFAAPLPADEELAHRRRPALHAEHRCEAPLERFRVRAGRERRGARRARRRSLRGESRPAVRRRPRPRSGRPPATPTPTALTTRYEIPCRVSGTIRVGRGGDRALDAARPARPLLGHARLVVDGLGVERRAASRTARACTP